MRNLILQKHMGFRPISAHWLKILAIRLGFRSSREYGMWSGILFAISDTGGKMSGDKESIYFDSFTSLRGIFTIGIVLFHINDIFERTSENVLGFAYNWGGAFR